jgi:aminopeptidase N
LTRRGLKWYEQEFDMLFPFSKYDHIYVPALNVGAMEMVGAVTLTENYIFKNKGGQEASRARRAATILHEMSHMYFGNLVTPTWFVALFRLVFAYCGTFVWFVSSFCFKVERSLAK